MSGGENPRVAHHVEPGRRHDGREAAEQAERVEVDGDSAVREGAFQLDADEAVVERAHAPLSDGRAQDVLAERLEPLGKLR